MDNEIRFHIKGVHRLLTMNDLDKIPNVAKRCITVIDTRSQRNYRTNYINIINKFK